MIGELSPKSHLKEVASADFFVISKVTLSDLHIVVGPAVKAPVGFSITLNVNEF